jgi:hypothetical protein
VTVTTLSWIKQRAHREAVFVTILMALILGRPALSFAENTDKRDSAGQGVGTQEARNTLANFVWKKDESTGNELAASRSDSSFNFFDIGDLSPGSKALVEKDLGQLAAAAGLAIERTSGKYSTILIFHDTKVFSRLKDDKPAFNSVGIPDNVLRALEKQTTDTSRCLNMTITDGKNNIVNTIVLVSEKFDGCLVHALLHSFGIRESDSEINGADVSAPEISAQTLIDVCILYEGRRREFRDRQSLAGEITKLRDLCIAKAGTQGEG